jgi:hypothetical protein
MGAFSELVTIEDAIQFMDAYIKIAESWLACKNILLTRYEDLIQNYSDVFKRTAVFYGANIKSDEVIQVFNSYQPEKGSHDQVGTHFVKGRIGRYRDHLTKAQQELCLARFGDFLKKMEYPIP